MKHAILGAVLAALTLLCVLAPAEARRAHRISLAPVPVPGSMVDDRYLHLRLPEAYGTARALERSASHEGPVMNHPFTALAPEYGRLPDTARITAALSPRAIAKQL